MPRKRETEPKTSLLIADVCLDPKDPQFFHGASVEQQLSVLKYVAPKKYDAIGVLVFDALREAFLKLRRDPSDAREDVH